MQHEVNKELLFKEFNLEEAQNKIAATNKRNTKLNDFFDQNTADLFLKNNNKLSLSKLTLKNLQSISDFLKSDLTEELKITHFNFELNSIKPIFYFNNNNGDRILLNQSGNIELVKNLDGDLLFLTFSKTDFLSLTLRYGTTNLSYKNSSGGFYNNRKVNDSLSLNFNNAGTRVDIQENISTGLIENLSNSIKDSRVKEVINSNIKLLKKICAHVILNIRAESDRTNFNDNFKKIPITKPSEFKDRMDIYYLLNDGKLPEDRKLEIDRIIDESTQQNIELSRPVR